MLARVLGHTSEEQATLRTGLRERAVGLDTLVGRRLAVEEITGAFQQALYARNDR